MMYQIEKAQAVWGGDVSADSYRIFRHEFQWNGGEKAELQISADSTFEVRINGSVLPIQQVADFPDDRTFSSLDVTGYLRPGPNEIIISVHFIGEDFLTYQTGVPYLQTVICSGDKILSATGPGWEYSSETPYRSGLKCKMTSQLGFVFEYDAAKVPGNWSPVQIVQPAGTLRPRSVPQLLELPRPQPALVQFGILKREGEKSTFAETCSEDYLKGVDYDRLFASARREENTYRSRKFRLDGKTPFVFNVLSNFPGGDGFYVICDQGCETEGYLTFRLDAPAGTIVDIVHGEHLEDGRVRGFVGGRNFTDRCHCRAGLNEFTFRHRRLGGRYLELHITGCCDGTVTLYDLGLIPLEIPLPEAAAFRCEDRALLHFNRLSERTLKLCMHEHYEDCPWREQGLYAYDSRNQILYGYYVWGNYEFAAACLNLLGKSCGDRYLTLTAPGKHGLTIPIFTLVWISELYEHQLYSGSGELFTRWRETVDRILDRALAEPVPGHEKFYHPGTGKEIWNFCEWQGRLFHVDRHPQSVYNGYLAEALKAGAALHRLAGNTERADYLTGKADALGIALEQAFWRGDGYTVFTDEPSDSRLYEHIQALFLAGGLVPEKKYPVLLQTLRRHELFDITFSGMPYLIRGLMKTGPEGRKMLTGRLNEIFDPMIFSNATSLSETSNGADDFDNAGSLCHAWSAVSPFWCGNVLLGVRPLTPGFACYEVKPYCGDLTHAEGEVPTPHGMIRVAWRRNLRNEIELEIEQPAGLECVVSSWKEFPVVGSQIRNRS